MTKGEGIMKKLILVIIFAVSGYSISGCSIFTPPREKPLLLETFDAKKDDAASYAVVATNATRRVAVLDVLNGTICVEPPPEAANTISEAFTALLEADISDKAEISASLSKSIAQNIDQLYRRTQSVQLYRDAVFALCQNAINGSLTIDDDAQVKITGEETEKLAEFLKKNTNLFNAGQYSEEISLLRTDNIITPTTIDLIEQINSKGSKNNTDFAVEDTQSLKATLQKAQIERDSKNIFEKTAALLSREIKDFYAAEKLRFITELAKPVEVCGTYKTIYSTKKEQKEDSAEEQKGTPTQTIKSNCTIEVPDNLEKIITPLVNALLPPAE